MGGNMKKVFFVLFMCCSGSAFAIMCGPEFNACARCEWSDNSNGVPIKNLAYGVLAEDDEAEYLLCDDPVWSQANAVVQVACTNQNGWAEQDMDISAVSAGTACWQRRTHVRNENGVLVEDVGPWVLDSVNDTYEHCLEYCGSCYGRVYNPTQTACCGPGLRGVLALPRY